MHQFSYYLHNNNKQCSNAISYYYYNVFTDKQLLTNNISASIHCMNK